ncbi:hypothetical protein Tco_0972244 [Tanacetum coccineum]
MFDPPLSDDAIWSLALQQKMINWRHQELASPKQNGFGKRLLKSLMVDSFTQKLYGNQCTIAVALKALASRAKAYCSASTLVSTGRRVSIVSTGSSL